MAIKTARSAREIPSEVIDWVEQLHRLVDELVVPLAKAHGPRLKCRKGCHDCCLDGLSVFEIEAAVIERHYPDLLAGASKNDGGGCVFLDEQGQCRIYAHRPYVCRTQGLPLRWLERDADGQPAEVRDVCPLNAEGPPLEELGADECWTIGPIEERLAARQSALDGDEGRRIPLRNLFSEARRHLPIVP